MHKEFVPPGQMVNGKFFYDILRRLRENIQHKCPDNWCNNSWVLHRDSASAHASLIVQQFLASAKMTVIPHPSYSPDLTPYDFFLLTKMKLKFKEQLLTALKRSRTNHGM
jgi:hypothetical protein